MTPPRVGSDETDDEPLTELEVEVDPSALAEGLSESTVTRTGASAILASLDPSSPADTEPSTLEPQLVVRGLGPSPLGSSPRTLRAAGTGRESDPDVYDDDEDRTTQNVEARLLEVYEQQLASGRGAPIRAAGRPSSEPVLDPDISEITVRNGAELVGAADLAHAPDDEETDEEASLELGSLPSARRELVGIEDARARLDQQAAAGGTVRMFYDPRTGKATAHAENDGGPPPAPAPAPAIVHDVPPSALAMAVVPRRSKRRSGRVFFVFVVACGLTGSGVYYRARVVPWVKAHLPGDTTAPAAAVAPVIAAAAPEPSASAAAPAVSSSSVVVEPVASASASASAQRGSKKHPPVASPRDTPARK